MAVACHNSITSKIAGFFRADKLRTPRIFHSARVAKLADAPDLGLRSDRFQSIACRFKAKEFYEWKTGFSYEIGAVANGE